MNRYAIILLLIAILFFAIGYKTRFRDENATKVIELHKVSKEDQFIFLRKFSHTMNAIGLAISISAIICLFAQRLTITSIVIAVGGIAVALYNLYKINKFYKNN